MTSPLEAIRQFFKSEIAKEMFPYSPYFGDHVNRINEKLIKNHPPTFPVWEGSVIGNRTFFLAHLPVISGLYSKINAQSVYYKKYSKLQESAVSHSARAHHSAGNAGCPTR